MKKNIFIIIIILLFTQCIPIPKATPDTEKENIAKSNEKVLVTHDFIYEPKLVKTIQMFPEPVVDDAGAKYRPAVISLAQNPSLILEFDILGQDYRPYHAKIQHCNFDWTPSTLNEIEYLNDVNDFPIRNYELSFNTRISYVHYSFKMPKLKISGNYIIYVHKEGDDKDFLFVKRFIVYDTKVVIESKVRPSQVPSRQDKDQQIDFKFKYSNFETVNPREEFKVVIRQNFRTDNSIVGLKPFMVREFDKLLEFNYLTGENTIEGGNEFRRFDIKSLRFLGFNVARIILNDTLNIAIIPNEFPRGNESYFRIPDLNGGFVIFHFETNRGKVESDYVSIKFTLNANEKFENDVYVIGGFNGFICNQENKMTYDEEKKQYIANILMKQGEYNYMYGILNPKTKKIETIDLEGCHQDTENNYEIIVYHKPFGARTDSVVGYHLFNSNQMR
jgi:hypothetical protein